MKHACLVLFVAGQLLSFSIAAQPLPPGGITVETSDTTTVPDQVFSTREKKQGGVYDTAVFDSVGVKVPFKVYEWRGEEMIHNWVTPGCPRAPHIYAGAGFYRFDKYGMSDVQFGIYPGEVPGIWEKYVAASRMIFLRKKSKDTEEGICIAHGYSNGGQEHYEYIQKLRRDRFYGITTGVMFEGIPNLKNKTMYIARGVEGANGELQDVVLRSYRQISVSAGLSVLRCRNVEYEAPQRRTGRLHASTMSRLTVGGAYYPVNELDVRIDSGYVVSIMERAEQKKFAAFVSWEGRLAFLSMRRECGLYMNFMFMCPSWNRINDFPLTCVNSWGLYFSLDRKVPAWRKRYDRANPA